MLIDCNPSIKHQLIKIAVLTKEAAHPQRQWRVGQDVTRTQQGQQLAVNPAPATRLYDMCSKRSSTTSRATQSRSGPLGQLAYHVMHQDTFKHLAKLRHANILMLVLVHVTPQCEYECPQGTMHLCLEHCFTANVKGTQDIQLMKTSSSCAPQHHGVAGDCRAD